MMASGARNCNGFFSFWWNPVSTPAVSTATEEWTGAGAPVGAWSTGNSMNARRASLGAGTHIHLL